MISRMQVQEEGVDADATPAISRQQTSSDQETRKIVSFGTPVRFYFYVEAQLVRMGYNMYSYLAQGWQQTGLGYANG